MRFLPNIPLLRIVPDDTHFHFMRFRRVSFPVSALLSIVAIMLFFHPGLNLGIDFIGGTLLEIQSKSGPADLAKMRATLTALNLGDVQLQSFGGPENVLIRVAQQPGGEQRPSREETTSAGRSAEKEAEQAPPERVGEIVGHSSSG